MRVMDPRTSDACDAPSRFHVVYKIKHGPQASIQFKGEGCDRGLSYDRSSCIMLIYGLYCMYAKQIVDLSVTQTTDLPALQRLSW